MPETSCSVRIYLSTSICSLSVSYASTGLNYMRERMYIQYKKSLSSMHYKNIIRIYIFYLYILFRFKCYRLWCMFFVYYLHLCICQTLFVSSCIPCMGIKPKTLLLQALRSVWARGMCRTVVLYMRVCFLRLCSSVFFFCVYVCYLSEAYMCVDVCLTQLQILIKNITIIKDFTLTCTDCATPSDIPS